MSSTILFVDVISYGTSFNKYFTNVSYFILYFILTFPLIVFIKSVNHINHEQILLWYQKSIRCKTACTFIYKKYANSLINTSSYHCSYKIRKSFCKVQALVREKKSFSPAPLQVINSPQIGTWPTTRQSLQPTSTFGRRTPGWSCPWSCSTSPPATSPSSVSAPFQQL